MMNLALVASFLTILTPEKHSFDPSYWTPRQGTRLTYHVRQILRDLTHEWDVPIQIGKVRWFGVQIQEFDVVYGFTLRGDQYYAPPDHRIGNSLLGGFRYPDRRLRIGETWTARYKQVSEKGAMAARVSVTYKGLGSYKERNTHEFGFEFVLANGIQTNGTAWISTEDGTLIRRESKVENYSFHDFRGIQTFREEVMLK